MDKSGLYYDILIYTYLWTKLTKTMYIAYIIKLKICIYKVYYSVLLNFVLYGISYYNVHCTCTCFVYSKHPFSA
jgi:hypothetical protein